MKQIAKEACAYLIIWSVMAVMVLCLLTPQS